VSKWVQMLESLCLIFRLAPFGGPRIRAVKKEAKHYHYDWTAVSDPGHRLENLVACHLYKWVCFRQDTEGRDLELRYFRDTDKREVDFVVTEQGKPVWFVECKSAGEQVHPALRYLLARFPGVKSAQVVMDAPKDVRTKEGIRICPVHTFLAELI
jgi:predicted AAA+ superfamily ATPase